MHNLKAIARTVSPSGGVDAGDTLKAARLVGEVKLPLAALEPNVNAPWKSPNFVKEQQTDDQSSLGWDSNASRP
jgi:hypothetical protein